MPAATASRLWETVGQQVRDTDGIDSDSTVCVVRSEEADPVVSEVIAGAARSMGASVTIHQYPAFRDWCDDFYLPDPIHAAIRESDWLLSNPYQSAAQFCWSKSVVGAIVDEGVRHVTFFGDADVLCGPAMGWPDELAFEVESAITNLVFDEDKTVHVEDDKGTDYTFTGTQDWTHPVWRPGLRRAQPGLGADEKPWRNYITIYPRGEVGWNPAGSGEGRLVFDGMDTYGLLNDPIEWSIEDGAVVDIDGGEEASHLETWIDDIDTGGRRLISEGAFGFNPKCRWNTDDPGMAELYFRPGTFHVAMGMSTLKKAPSETIQTHIDGILLDPTVTVDDRCIIDDGDLLLLEDVREDPDVRAVASKYGDPDELLVNEY
jgi:hypothetical protein